MAVPRRVFLGAFKMGIPQLGYCLLWGQGGPHYLQSLDQ